MPAKKQPKTGFDIAAIGTLIILRSPNGEIVHFNPQEAIDVAERLVEHAVAGGGRPRRRR